jgi:phosphatidylinositol alpha-1,6-mannosyltransferase
VLREALASGRPVVATRVGDVDEVIHHRKHGLIVSPGAQEEMAAAILELLQNRELAAKCARNGLQLAREQFCFDRMMHHKLQVDTEVVALHRDQSAVRAAASLARDYIRN